MAEKLETPAATAALKNDRLYSVGSLLALPVTISLTALDLWTRLAKAWWKLALAPTYQHPHEGHAQLEVPDPIELDGERDLFA